MKWSDRSHNLHFLKVEFETSFFTRFFQFHQETPQFLFVTESFPSQVDKKSRGPQGERLKTQQSKNEDYGIRSHHIMANRWGNNGSSADFVFLGSKITVDSDCCHEIKRPLLLGRKAMTNPDSILKSRDITLPTKVQIVKAMVFSSSHVWMGELDYK